MMHRTWHVLQFRGTGDGKTLAEFFKYEIDPVKNHTPETWASIMMNIYTSILRDLERGAQRLAAGLDPKPDHTPSTTRIPQPSPCNN
jgi:hypothetical protein